MTVNELIRKLEEYDGDMQVKIDTVETCQVEWSNYHDKFVLPREGKDSEKDVREAVVLI